MDCNNVCRLCDRLILSQAVTFAGGTLTINSPAGSYEDEIRNDRINHSDGRQL